MNERDNLQSRDDCTSAEDGIARRKSNRICERVEMRDAEQSLAWKDVSSDEVAWEWQNIESFFTPALRAERIGL